MYYSTILSTNLYINKLNFFINIKQFCQKYTTYILNNSNKYWLENYYKIKYLQNQKSINQSIIDLSYFKQMNDLIINRNLYSDVITNMFTSKGYIYATNNNGLTSEMNLSNAMNQQNHNEKQVIQYERYQRNQLQECTHINSHSSTRHLSVMRSKCLRSGVATEEKITIASNSFKNYVKSCHSPNQLSTSSVRVATRKSIGNVNQSERLKKFQNSKHLVDSICSSDDNLDQSRLSNSVAKNSVSINSVIDHSKRTLVKPDILSKKQINKQDPNKTYETNRLRLTARSHQNQSQTALPSKSQGNVNQSERLKKFQNSKHLVDSICSSDDNLDQSRLSNSVAKNSVSINSVIDHSKRTLVKPDILSKKQINKQDPNKTYETNRLRLTARSHQNQSQTALPTKSQKQHPAVILPSSTSSVSYRLSNLNRPQSSTPLGKPRTSCLSNSKVSSNKYSVIRRTSTLRTLCLCFYAVEIYHEDLSFTFAYLPQLVPDDLAGHEITTVSNGSA
ncbi:uncharacterized protein DC041_0013042 [Schistosoma bovis]|uniref:Uncharacterized protein n=1 Tax=Schistosoma bovis TaxID=6184 RepID=A0A430QTC0_SCHBO|nr:uncharacterized protein DC041_0013042 [Schistosoma bovis]